MMRIQGNPPNHEPAGTNRVEAVRPDRSAKADRQAGAESDRLDLSPDAQLITNAMRAAEGAPLIRHDLVEQMRQKLAAGEIGNDSTRLADRLIDHLLGR